jgi:YfiH family protein
MAHPALKRYASHGVTLIGDPNTPFGVTLAFTERTGGVSLPPYDSLNLADITGDDARAVEENRRRALAAMGAGAWVDSLVSARQVHGDEVVTIGRGHECPERARAIAASGADAFVCLERQVPVLICVADCVPVVLVAPYRDRGAFAVIHAGWRGTLARIAAKALGVLVEAAGADASEVLAYVGPHIGVDDYEVSADLAGQFRASFGDAVVKGERNVDLGEAIALTLGEAGVHREHLVRVDESSASHTDRFFSYRAEGERTGRMGAIAFVA